MSRKHRNAGTGEYVSEEYAKANPRTTVSEADPERSPDVAALVEAVKAHQVSVQALADSVGALAQCVAMLLEEELGTPVPDKQEAVETDMDGRPVTG